MKKKPVRYTLLWSLLLVVPLGLLSERASALTSFSAPSSSAYRSATAQQSGYRYRNEAHKVAYKKKYQKRYKDKNSHEKKYKHSARSYGFPKKRKATGRRVFIFSPRLKAWAAYDTSGQLVRTGRASGGKGYCADVKRACRTPRGSFRIHRKGSVHCRSSRYPLGKGGAPMPYCMFFLRNYAIHGSPDVPNYNASHGCIRVLPKAAQWLHSNFIRIGTTVIVSPY